MTSRHYYLFADIFVAGALSFGGLAAVLGDLRGNVVTRHQLVTLEEFTGTYALAVGAPGPNAIFLSLLGYKVAGLLGVLVAMVAWGIPTILILSAIARTSSSQSSPLIKEARKALVPVVAGLLVAGAVAAASTFSEPERQWGLTAAALAVLLARPKLNPVWVVFGCAGVGAFVL